MQTLEQLFAEAARYRFEPGMGSPFIRELLERINADPDATLPEVERLVHSPETCSDVAAEVVRWLGVDENAVTQTRRRHIIEGALTNYDYYVRDMACQGLSSLEDPDALPAVNAAHRRATIREERDDLMYLRSELESVKTTREVMKAMAHLAVQPIPSLCG